jgi:glycosyltransferase involved in cell wall biosynthesis
MSFLNPNSINKPKYSIIIPTYNTDVVLIQCLEALCNQSVEKNSFEVIVVNDGGKTEIYEKVKSFKKHFDMRYFYQKNKGPAAARNLGIKNAKGNIILLLDDDSLPTKNWFKSVTKAWEKFPDFDGIGGYTISKVTDSIYCRVNSDFFNWYLAQYSDDQLHTFLVTCNAGYRKSVINSIGNFDESFKKASGEDRDLNIKISKIGGKLRLDENILVYHDRDLTLRSYIKKHFNNGKAAHNIYVRYPELSCLSSDSYFYLYTSILKNYRSFKEKIIAFFLLTLSQVGTIVGYYSAVLFNKN